MASFSNYGAVVIVLVSNVITSTSREPTEEALEKAKQHLDKYVVVGVAEDYEDFLKVLEKLLPEFFGGIVDEFKTSTESKYRLEGGGSVYT